MRAFRKKRGLINWDWYFGARMETSSLCEKDKKIKDRHLTVCSFAHLLCTQFLNKILSALSSR